MTWEPEGFKFWICSGPTGKISYPEFGVNSQPSGIDLKPTSTTERLTLYMSFWQGTIGEFYVILPEQGGYLYGGWPSWSEARSTILESYQYARQRKPFAITSSQILCLPIFHALHHSRTYLTEVVGPSLE